jgi:pilus assembly protein CpaB
VLPLILTDMNPRQRRGVALLTVSVIGAFGVFSAVSRYTASVARQLGPTRPVLTLAHDVPAYGILDRSDFTVTEIPAMYATGGQLGRYEQIDGRVPAMTLPAGTRMQSEVLVPVPEAHAGEREVTVNVGVEASIAAALEPGDYVDIVAAYTATGKQKAYAQITVSGARVLRIRTLAQANASTKQVPAGTLAGDTTLAVTFALVPDAVAKVVLAQTVAKTLRLALQPRGVAATAPKPAPPAKKPPAKKPAPKPFTGGDR